jgi:two-component system, sensor histidine kinase PdtaS
MATPPWRTLRGRVALLLGVSLTPMGVHAFYDAALLPIFMWLVAVAASWGAAHVFVTQPLLTLEVMAKAFARGDIGAVMQKPRENAPAEIASLQNSLLAMAQAIRGREEAVAEALIEQRALLREVNHRVMNNLQVVLSLLSIQARDADSADQKSALARAHRRIQLLALIQGQIYASAEVHDIRLDQLLAETARTVIDTREAHLEKVSLTLALEAVRMTTDRAASFAFLIAEMLSQTLDRVAGDKTATLALSLRHIGESEIEVSMSTHGAARARGSSEADGRMISDMARNIAATITTDQDRPMSMKIRLSADTAARVAQ